MDCEAQTACPSPQRDQHPSAEALRQKLRERNQHGWRRIALHFTPSWFSVNMGTGVVSILLYTLHYNADWLRYIAICIFALNVALFFAFLAASITRYTAFPGIFLDMLRHPTQSLFLGTFPMGFATICNMFVYVCVSAWGPWAMNLAWAMWWVDAALAMAICLFLPFAIMYVHHSGHSSKTLQDMTAVWLLPVVSTIVASATGGITAEALFEAGRTQHALWTVVVSYVLLGTGLPLALVILVIYFQRLTLHRLPPLPMIVSVFLPMGPLGQGAFSLMQLGHVGSNVLPTIQGIPMNIDNQAGMVLRVFGVVVSLMMWGYGLAWLFFAIVSITRSKVPFNMGWWAFTFPLGVYAISTAELGRQLGSSVFAVLGTIFSLAVVILWLVVAVQTVINSWKGTTLFAPCAQAFEERWIDEKVELYARSSEGQGMN